MPDPLVIHCSPTNPRVLSVIVLMGLLSLATLIAGFTTIGTLDPLQIAVWLLIVVAFALMPVAYLRRTRLVLDDRQLRVHVLIGPASKIDRDRIKAVTMARRGTHFVLDEDGRRLTAFRDLWSYRQLETLLTELRADLIE
ncbi:hypothetical protein [Kutzneria kofuensis]|uniref:PH (Pleckstrin Homology) domain-containing protein n=1 Tax=Kutzneria kofuensis TaxID=103725 RepID=A0A7W9KJE2_9PSEU|nr:hypothetical protein [Kutzneria kofuensis]MBB5893698.1 hypothetical protein [Kutzneria kofuensis]